MLLTYFIGKIMPDNGMEGYMKKAHYKLIFDIGLTIIVVLLMKIVYTGMLLHEVVGLAAGVLFLVHKALNFKWIKCACRKLTAGHFKGRNLTLFVTGALMLLSVTVLLVTGIGISQELFGLWYGNENLKMWIAVHHSSAYLSLILISVHIGLHWKTIMCMAKKAMKLNGKSRVRTYAARGSVLAMAVLGIRGLFLQDVGGNLLLPLQVPAGGGNSEEQDGAAKAFESATASDSAIVTEPTAESAGMGGITALASVTGVSADIQAAGLEDYLSGLICTACHKHCLLTSPQCFRGEEQAAEAETQYYAQLAAAEADPADSAAAEQSEQDTQTDEAVSAGAANDTVDDTDIAPESTGTEQEAQASAQTNEMTEAEDAASPNTGESGGVAAAPQDDETNEATESSEEEGSTNPLVDYIPIMGLFAAGTHYTVSIPRYRKRAEK